MELLEKKCPAQNRCISAGQNNADIKPDFQAKHKTNHTADYRASHPERKPYEDKQPDDAIFLYLAFVGLGRLLDTLDSVPEPFEHYQVPPAKHKQGIENKHQDCFNYHADWHNCAVSKAEGIPEGHGGSSAEHDLGGGHSNIDLRILRSQQQLNPEPESE